MVLERIYVRRDVGETCQQRLCAELVAGMGIEGDRYFGVIEQPSVNVTLIEAEVLEDFFRTVGLPVNLGISGRNLVTRGVRLNAWVGREFQVGRVRLRGVERADPCLTLGRAVAERLSRALAETPGASPLSPPDIVKHFTQRGGLRAEVLYGGEVRVGDPVLEGF
jgi:MOSC domain-containing protein YiiM